MIDYYQEVTPINRPVHNLVFHGVGSPNRELPLHESRYWITHKQWLMICDDLATRQDVVMTFDDGNDSDLSIVLSTLTERHLKAKFFISTALLGQPGYLTRSGVRRLYEAGMDIGSHGHEHVNWRQLDPAVLAGQIDRSLEILESICETPITDAAMPSGQYDRQVLAVLRRAGFEKVYTVDGPWSATRRWIQPRYPVRQSDTVQSLNRVLNASRISFQNVRRIGRRWIKRIR